MVQISSEIIDIKSLKQYKRIINKKMKSLTLLALVFLILLAQSALTGLASVSEVLTFRPEVLVRVPNSQTPTNQQTPSTPSTSSCPEWNPTITPQTTISNYPSGTTQNNPPTIQTGDSICEVAVVQKCIQYTRYARNDHVFDQNFKRNLDITYYGGRIIAYRIQWWSGSWSGWFVPGVNDLDEKQTPTGSANYMRRYWSYFSDHSHSFILCK